MPERQLMGNNILSKLKITLSAFRLFLAFCFVAFAAVSYADNPETPNIQSQDKRYADNGNDTITDAKTGLMWMKMDAYQQTGHLLDWNGARAFVETLNKESFAGHNDWRVPTRKELVTLYEADKLNGSLVMNVHIDPIFASNGLAALWSSEPNGQFNAFGVVFNTGEVFSSPTKSKAKKSVRAVRNIK